jgi:hypothetical protein
VYRAINPNSLGAHATEKQARRFSKQAGGKTPSLMITEIWFEVARASACGSWSPYASKNPQAEARATFDWVTL